MRSLIQMLAVEHLQNSAFEGLQLKTLCKQGCLGGAVGWVAYSWFQLGL